MTRLNRLTMQGFKSFANRITIPFPAGYNVIAGPNGSGKSTRWDTQILLESCEMKPIGEIVERALKKSKMRLDLDDGIYTIENPENVRTYGLDQNTMKIVKKNVTAFIKRKGEPYLYELKTGTGRSVVTTGCHPVMIFRNGTVVSEVVENLRQGDLVATPRKLDLPEIEMNVPKPESEKKKAGAVAKNIQIPAQINENFSRFLGYLVGDGCIIPKANRCDFTNSDPELLDDFTTLSKEIGIEPSVYVLSNSKAVVLALNSSTLCRHLVKIFKSNIKKEGKHIPEFIMFSKKTVLANFLASLFDCDGTVRKDNPTFEYTTMSETLANQVQLALLRFGIVSRKTSKMKCATNTINKTKKRYFYISIEGKEKLLILYSSIPLRCAHKSDRLKELTSKNVKSGSNIDILPQETNVLVQQCTKLLGLKYKPMRKKHPWFAAYNENRCCPTRLGIGKALLLFRKKYADIESMKNLQNDKDRLLSALRVMNISNVHASKEIGLSRGTINGHWIQTDCAPRSYNLQKLGSFAQCEIKTRLQKAEDIMGILENLCQSDIFWDRIEKIEKVKGEEWVYDLTIPNCHNFIGNGIFVHNSNVIDALTFVLGTTSARTIRAQKLQNLIFNGGKSRKPADYCEVSIYLDNTDKKLPIEEDEVKITRRITRSGISIYKLNGRTVTRTKILDVLSQAGLSPDGYNIIMQGDVTKIIEMSSQERKEIIDDISGISEFSEKRDKAISELEKVELRVRENMIVVAEKQRLVARLREEKENAEKYVKLEKELRKSKASLVKKRLDDADEKMLTLGKEIDESSKSFDKMEKEFSSLDANLEKKEKGIMKKSEQLIEKSRNIDILRKIDAMQTDIVRKKDKIDFNYRELERLKTMSMEAERNIAVREVINMNEPGVHGTVSTLVQVPQDYSTALEVAIGRHSSDIVVSDDDVASFCIKKLKEKRVGRARFLPLTKMRSRERKMCKEKSIIGYAIDLIEFDKKYEPAINYVLGSTLVVKNIDIAKRIRNFRIVTLDGDLVEVSGAMIGGFYKKKKGTVSYAHEIAQLESESQRLEEDIEKIENDLEKLKGEQQEETKEVQKLEESKTQETQEIEELRKRRKDLYEERLVMQGKISKMRIEKARLEANLDNLHIEFEEYKDVKEFFKQSSDELQERVRQALIEINKIGPVNMKAIEEFGTINVEFEELKKKLDRLLDEKNAVMNVVSEIEKRRYGKFMETFNNINSFFAKIYSDLSGGTAELRLEIENNIDSGLLITANPSGKKILNMDSMSGGEKTMASLSFLFAIMQHYASPFYVLDEIDAALDKANTRKVANLIKKYSKTVQFLVISHNDYTISEGEKVFGVSMEEGVSRVFGIDMTKG
jgi:chromosome segregation protein